MLSAYEAAFRQGMADDFMREHHHIDGYVTKVEGNGKELALSIRPASYDPDGMYFWKRIDLDPGMDTHELVESVQRQAIGLCQYARHKYRATPKSYVRAAVAAQLEESNV